MQINQKVLDYIETLYREMASMLFHYSNLLFETPSIAEEAVQETFIIALINYKKLISCPNPKGWVMNTHKNVCRNIQKTQTNYLKHILSIEQFNLSPQSIEEDFEFETDIANLVSSEDFNILKKIILDGYSYKDLAIELGISIAACKKRFERAKKRFRKNFFK